MRRLVPADRIGLGCGAAFGIVFSSFVVALPAQQLLADIHTGPGQARSSSPRSFATLANGRTFFVADHHAAGRLIYETGGTAASTRFLPPIGVQPAAEPTQMLGVGTTLFFTGLTGSHGAELWATDGTSAGTRLVLDIIPGSEWSNPRDFIELSGRLLFVTHRGTQLWVSDGTTIGTTRIRDFRVSFGGMIEHLVWFQNRVWFTAPDPVNGGRHLWSTDGTTQGTVALTTGLDALDAAGTTVVGNVMYFVARSDPQGPTLWLTDGTRAGTRRIRAVRANPRVAWADLNGNLVFPTEEFEVWTSDGTLAGTQRLRQFGTTVWPPGEIVTVGSRAYFAAAEPATGAELWSTDGTPGGTQLVRDIQPGSPASQPMGLIAFGGRLFFSAGSGNRLSRLWVSDGTLAGTREMPGSISMRRRPHVLPGGGAMVFAGSDFVDGEELWLTDGTATRLVANLDASPNGDADASGLVQLGRFTLFAADDGVHGSELWRTDGTTVGTQLVRDINPSGGSRIRQGTRHGDHVYFEANDGTHGRELWRTDGTTAGTHLVTDLLAGGNSSSVQSLFSYRGALLFSAAGDGGAGIWTTDGTASGTRLVTSATGAFQAHCEFEGKVYFNGHDAQHGRELWVTDGTAAGTFHVFDFYPGPLESNPGFLGIVGGRMLFRAFRPGVGIELWSSDGTTSGTVLVRDIAPGQTHSSPRVVHVLPNGIGLFVAYSPAVGLELWRTDGTSANTALVVDNLPGSEAGAISIYGVVNGHALFAGHDGDSNFELWCSDGTAAGTSRVVEINPLGAALHTTLGLVVGERFLYFGAERSGESELWRSDGTASGTMQVGDIWPGPFSSRAQPLLFANGRLFFGAEAPGIGQELWTVDPGAVTVEVGRGCGDGAAREPRLSAGAPILGTNWTIHAADTSLGASGVVLFSAVVPPAFVPLVACEMFVDLTNPIVVAAAGNDGTFRVTIPVPNTTSLNGLTLALQGASAPTDAPLGFDLTNGCYATLGQ